MIGIVLIALGLMMRLWAALSNPDFSLLVKTPKAVATKGPYAYVRHPAYVGSLLVLSGLGLTLTSWQNVVLPVIVLHALLAHRADQEESLILGQHPEYALYQQRVGKFFPKLKVVDNGIRA